MNVEIAIGVGRTSSCSNQGHRNKGCPLAISLSRISKRATTASRPACWNPQFHLSGQLGLNLGVAKGAHRLITAALTGLDRVSCCQTAPGCVCKKKTPAEL